MDKLNTPNPQVLLTMDNVDNELNNLIRVESSNIMDNVVTYVVGKGKLKLLQNISVNTIKSNGQAISLNKNEKFIKSIKLSKKHVSLLLFLYSYSQSFLILMC